MGPLGGAGGLRRVVGLGAAALVAAGPTTVVALLWGVDGFVFAWVGNFAAMGGAALTVEVLRPALRGGRFRVRRWEPRLYRRLGVGAYARLLRRVGWTAVITRRRGFTGTRAGLAALDRETRKSEWGHLVVGGLGLAAAVVVGSAGWLLAFVVVGHLYPVLLQRSVRWRIQRLSGRPGWSSPNGGG